MYALADCNNFFASCERVFRPELNGKPVIVLSNNDGCAVARSNEAKALGIKMGDPLFKIRDIVEKNHVHVFSGNFALYGDMSRRVQEVLRNYSPSIEVYSIDEAFLDLDGMDVDFDKYAKEISRECWRQTSIPVSVGIAPTKTLAKIASKLCKGNPNDEDSEYKASIELLYGIAFTIKMSKMGDHRIEGYFDFVVPPLEGLWWSETGEVDYGRKEDFHFISMICLPDFVTKEDFDWAVETATKKKKRAFPSTSARTGSITRSTYPTPGRPPLTNSRPLSVIP